MADLAALTPTGNTVFFFSEAFADTVTLTSKDMPSHGASREKKKGRERKLSAASGI